MAIEKIINLNVESNADEAVGSLRSQLRAAQADVATLSEKFGVTSKEAINAAKRAGELKDKIADAKSLTDAFNPDAKFKALSGALAGVAGGFAAVQGGMALFGEESKDVEKTLLKVQSAMALAQGLDTVKESVDKFKELGAVVKSYTIVQRISTAVQAAFNAVMAANPIGAVVVAVTALIAAGYALVKMFQASSDETKKAEAAHKALGKELKNQVEAQKAATIEADLSRDAQLKMAKASGKSADEIRKLSVELANQEVAQKIANAQTLRAIAIEAIRVAGLEDATDAQKELAKNALKEFNDANELAKTAVLNRRKLLIDNKVAETQEQTDAIKKANEKTEKLEDEATQKKVKKAEDEAAALKAIEDKKLADDMKSAQDAINILNTLSQNNETPAEKAEREYQDRKAVLEANNLSTEELTRQHLNNLAKIELDIAAKKIEKEDSEFLRLQELTLEKDEYDKLVLTQKYESEYLAAEGNGELQKQLKIKLDNDILAVDQATADAQNKIEELKTQAKQKALSAYSSTLKTAASLLGESTDAGKAAAIAATTIDTIQSGVSAFKGMTAAVPGPVGIALGAVAAAGALASGYASVKKIIAVKTPKGGGGGGSAPSGGGAAAPQFNVVGNSGVNQLADVMNTQQQTPVKAYVVPSDVTTGQSLDRNIIRNASLG
jgi:hypothetical protein